MATVVDYTITRGIPIISQSGSVCTRVGETLAKWLEEGTFWETALYAVLLRVR